MTVSDQPKKKHIYQVNGQVSGNFTKEEARI